MKFSYEGRAGSWGYRYSEQVSFPGKDEERQRTEEAMGVSSKEGCRDSMRGAGAWGKCWQKGRRGCGTLSKAEPPECTVGRGSLWGRGAAALGGVRSSLQGHTKEAQMFEKHLD